MKSLITRAGKILSSKRGEMYVDKAVGIIISVVIGSLLLAGIYYLFNSIVLPGLAERIQDMFGGAGGSGSGGSGGVTIMPL